MFYHGCKKFLFIVVIFLVSFSLYGAPRLSSPEGELFLDSFLFKMSDYDPGAFYNGEGEGFSEYRGQGLLTMENSHGKMFTFKSSFLLDESLENTLLAFYIGPMPFPRQIWVNGFYINKNGRHGKIYNPDNASATSVQIPPGILKYGEDSNTLVIQVYPLFEPHPLEGILLASSDTVSGKVFWRNFFHKNLIQAAVIIGIILSLFFTFLFITGGYSKPLYLYFSLLCLGFSFSYFTMAFSYNMGDHLIMEKISRSAFPLTLSALAFFCLELTGVIKNKKIPMFIISIPGIIIAVLTVIQSSNIGIDAVFMICMNFYIVPVLLFGLVIVVIAIFQRKTRKSIVMLISFLIIIAGGVSDVGNINSGRIPYAYMIPFGFLILVLNTFFMLSLDQAKLYIVSRRQAQDLDIKNKSLQDMIQKITLVSGNLVESSNRLGNIFNESASVIGNYEKENSKIISQSVDRFTEVEGAISNITKRIEAASMQVPEAILHQTSVVEEVTATVTNMNGQMVSIVESIEDSDRVAMHLSDVASKSSKNISESRASIKNISQYSEFISQVLNIIEDITEQTSILSINTAIEAARVGSAGSGFKVISGEIQKLSKKSKENLQSSFDKIKQLREAVNKSVASSDDLSGILFSIIDEAKKSAGKVSHLTTLLQAQKADFSEILAAITSLLKDTILIKELSEKEQIENEKIMQTMHQLNQTFSSIVQSLKKQSEKGSSLFSSINQIKEIVDENRKNVKILKESIQQSSTESQ